jgi:hypothetical protein
MHARAARFATLAAALLIVGSTVGATAAPAPQPHERSRSWAQPDRLDHVRLAEPETIDYGDVPSGPGKRKPARPPQLPSPFASEVSVDAAPGSRPAQAPSTVPAEATVNNDPDHPPISQPGFDGLAESPGTSTDGEPPDSYLAVGPEHIGQVVNSHIRFSDRSGTADPLGDTTLEAFVNEFGFEEFAPDAVWFDPRILYDSLHGRWLVSAVGWRCNPSPDGVNVDPETQSLFGDGYAFFATSDTIDPMGSWTAAGWHYPDYLIDYAAPGTSTDKFGFGWNSFAMILDEPAVGPAIGSCEEPAYVGTDVWAVDWADWLGTDGDWFPEVATTGPEYFTPRVAVQAPATSNRLHVVIELFDTGSGMIDHVYQSFTGSAAAGTFGLDFEHDMTSLGAVSEYLIPPDPVQPGSDRIDLFDETVAERPTDAVWQNNRLTSVSTYPCDPAGGGAETRDCVRVIQLDTTGVGPSVPPTLAQDFLIAESGADSFMGGIGVAGNGTLHVVWTRSSSSAPSGYPSSYSAYQLASDDPNTISPRELLKAGTGTYSGERWGDYAGVAQDPFVPNQAWQANQYADGGGEWSTFINNLQPLGTTYVPITPVRVLDTRVGLGLSGTFKASLARSWQVADEAFGIPEEAVAVSGNVTVTQQTKAGYLAVTPTPTNTPPSSTVNFPVGDNRANNLTVPLAADGKLSAVYKAGTGNTTHLLFDVTGYFLADDTGGTFTPIDPVNVLDSRDGTGLAGAFQNGVPRTLDIAEPGGVIPETAVAITGNVTVTQQTGGGYIAVTKDPDSTPETSTLNFPKGDNRANGLFAPLNSEGELSIVYKSGAAGATAHVLLDVSGFFEQATDGLRFVPMNPARIMETRPNGVLSGLTGPFSANTPRTLDVVGHWGVPADAQAISANLTVTEQTKAGYVSVTTTSNPMPETSTINFPVKDNRANGFVGMLDVDGDISAVYRAGSGNTIHLLLDLSGYFV